MYTVFQKKTSTILLAISVTCHPAEVTFPPLPQPKLVLDLATPELCKAELAWVNVLQNSKLLL